MAVISLITSRQNNIIISVLYRLVLIHLTINTKQDEHWPASVKTLYFYSLLGFANCEIDTRSRFGIKDNKYY